MVEINNAKSVESSKVASNLTDRELAGKKSLKKRVNAREIVITETDKSKRFSILTMKQYIESGDKHVKKDLEIQHSEIKEIQKTVNDHCTWLRSIFGI